MSRFNIGDRVTFTDGFGRKAEGVISDQRTWAGITFGVQRYQITRTDRGIANDTVLKYSDEIEFADTEEENI